MGPGTNINRTFTYKITRLVEPSACDLIASINHVIRVPGVVETLGKHIAVQRAHAMVSATRISLYDGMLIGQSEATEYAQKGERREQAWG